jgi:DNA-binding XRE family transcriptional regulator
MHNQHASEFLAPQTGPKKKMLGPGIRTAMRSVRRGSIWFTYPTSSFPIANCTGTRACNCCSIEKAVIIPDPKLPNPIRTVGDHIRSHRLAEQLTQAEVAKGIGVTPTALGQWETNKRMPSERFLPRITSFLGYNPQQARI